MESGTVTAVQSGLALSIERVSMLEQMRSLTISQSAQSDTLSIWRSDTAPPPLQRAWTMSKKQGINRWGIGIGKGAPSISGTAGSWPRTESLRSPSPSTLRIDWRSSIQRAPSRRSAHCRFRRLSALQIQSDGHSDSVGSRG